MEDSLWPGPAVDRILPCRAPQKHAVSGTVQPHQLRLRLMSICAKDAPEALRIKYLEPDLPGHFEPLR
ncbi:hypothetical protein J7E62_29175, partial [Variovorax paradoxus]|nr:hypothetical protein [Variovorax paradoxus]